VVIRSWGLRVADLVESENHLAVLRLNPANGGTIELLLTAEEVLLLRGVLLQGPRAPA
jgi:hypothetical protein